MMLSYVHNDDAAAAGADDDDSDGICSVFEDFNVWWLKWWWLRSETYHLFCTDNWYFSMKLLAINHC